MTEKAPMPKPITADEIRAKHEINGARRALTNLIVYALEELKPSDGQSNVEKLAAMTIERERAISAIRRITELDGEETDWSDDLPLAEIIEKHLMLRVAALLAKPSSEKTKR